MILHDTAPNLFRLLASQHPAALRAFERSKPIKPGLLDYQALALFALSARYDLAGTKIVELGSAVGYSASMIAQGAPRAEIVTLNPRTGEVPLLRKNLQSWPNVRVLEMYSWDYLKTVEREEPKPLGMVFVDGDHNAIARDLPWFNHLAVGGLFLCHDYTPVGARKPSPIVYAALNGAAERLGRTFDVCVVDDGKVGMAGFYRRPGETL